MYAYICLFVLTLFAPDAHGSLCIHIHIHTARMYICVYIHSMYIHACVILIAPDAHGPLCIHIHLHTARMYICVYIYSMYIHACVYMSLFADTHCA